MLGRLAQLDKAPDYGSGDSGFKSQGGHFFFVRGLHARRWETDHVKVVPVRRASSILPCPWLLTAGGSYWSNIYIVYNLQRGEPNRAAVSR